MAADVAAGRPVAVATVVRHPDPPWSGAGWSSAPEPDPVGDAGQRPPRRRRGRRRARPARPPGQPGLLTYGPDGERRGEGLEVFVAAYAPAPAMLVFGATDYAAAVAASGVVPGLPGDGVRRASGVRDGDAGSPTPTRSSSTGRTATSAAQAEQGLLDERTAVCVLSHDPKFDVPVLEVALRLPGARLRRGDGVAPHRRPSPRCAARPRPRPSASSPGSPPPSAWTSAPGPPRRPPSRSPPRSSPPGRVTRRPRSASPTARSTRCPAPARRSSPDHAETLRRRVASEPWRRSRDHAGADPRLQRRRAGTHRQDRRLLVGVAVEEGEHHGVALQRGEVLEGTAQPARLVPRQPEVGHVGHRPARWSSRVALLALVGARTT